MTYQQKGIWCYEFTFAGKLIRKSSGSPDRAVARQMETKHRHELEDERENAAVKTKQAPDKRLPKVTSKSLRDAQDSLGVHSRKASRRLGMSDEQLATIPGFAEAARLWIAEHQRYVKPRTVHSYNDAIKTLSRFFEDMPLNEIQISHVREYQDHRLERITPGVINRELGVFQQILREFDQWNRIESRYRRLIVEPSRAGHSLTAEEEKRLLAVAFTKKKWLLAAHCMTIMLSTTMGFGELRRLRRGDVDMARPCVTVREGAKNTYRHRTIPLNNDAFESMTWILKRWKKLGGSSDEHYILPHRPKTQRAEHWRKTIPWILTEPATAMTTAFESIRKAAGLPHFRLYDCRVQAITKLLSDPKVSPQTSREIAGHISQEMQNRYSIQQFDTKKTALDGLVYRAIVPPPGAPAETPAGRRVFVFPGQAIRRARN